MTSDARELLSALIDREPVDPGVLAEVLEDRDARAMLVDFVRLRGLVAADADRGSPEVGRRPTPRVRTTQPRWLAVAAAALLSVAAAGWWLLERAADHEVPPAPSRVVQFERGVDWQDGI